jgi:shikimate dehydrogenase
MSTLRLGLIGGNITESRSPALQIVCGLSVGRNVSYDLLLPQEQGLDLADLLTRCRAAGFDGINVTYPYKETVLQHVPAGEAVVAALGAANTITFSAAGALAWNTDCSGFVAAWRARVLMLGAGGVGRAIAFALAELGAETLLLHDVDATRAQALGEAVSGYAGVATACVDATGVADLTVVDGVINCTPLGMAGRPGSALPATAKGKPHWAFDAVYTPEHTLFRSQCEALGADVLSGYELYFHQGVQGFRLFSGQDVTRLEWVRRVLAGRE